MCEICTSLYGREPPEISVPKCSRFRRTTRSGWLAVFKRTILSYTCFRFHAFPFYTFRTGKRHRAFGVLASEKSVPARINNRFQIVSENALPHSCRFVFPVLPVLRSAWPRFSSAISAIDVWRHRTEFRHCTVVQRYGHRRSVVFFFSRKTGSSSSSSASSSSPQYAFSRAIWRTPAACSKSN